MAMLNRTLDKNSKDLFFVTSSDWEAVIEADGPSEAATMALETQLKEEPDRTNISSVIISLNITETVQTVDAEASMVVFDAPTILANAGYHEESKHLKGIIEDIRSES